jgi:DNA polymerase elongation subunit (family B)
MPKKTQIPLKTIETFLEGRDPEKYITAVEVGYYDNTVSLIINDPKRGKYIREDKFFPFVYFTDDIINDLYNGDRTRIKLATKQYGVKIKKLRTHDENGFTPNRLEIGYKYIAQTTATYNDLINFFRYGGVDIYSNEYKEYFLALKPEEQYLIQSGKRLFKGIDDYNDVHRFQFDIETSGLDPEIDRIFQIGVKDNRGFEKVINIKGEDPQEVRDNERLAIIEFFDIIDQLKPDLITAYNSENFDWAFIISRCERLNISVKEISKSLKSGKYLRRKDATVKFGGETEKYQQTLLWGYNILDISHSVRRAKAINSEIRGWSLKYITQYAEANKPNRVYIPGKELYSIWNDIVNDYAFNDENGDWYKVTGDKKLKEGYDLVSGEYLVERYLMDDLWETSEVDMIFKQADFLLAKLVPTSYQRLSTMGTAGIWKLIMVAWSYENGLAIPKPQKKVDFTGGLSRLLSVGYNRNVTKLDFAALYPNIEITWDIFPDVDITGVMKGFLTYIAETRDKYKDLKGKAEERGDFKKANIYDKKQLPLKILANSWFGSYGAPHLFPWGDIDCAEETTCRGRQYLRLMIKHFSETHGFRALVGDSVTHDTPIYVRDSEGLIDILPISDLFNEKSEHLDVDGLRDFEEKPFEVLTRGGWKKINYVYRHKTDKNIHRITTTSRMVEVTSDHSLFQNGKEVKPSELKVGDLIDIYEIPKSNINSITVSDEEAFEMGKNVRGLIPKEILNSNEETKRAFLRGLREGFEVFIISESKKPNNLITIINAQLRYLYYSIGEEMRLAISEDYNSNEIVFNTIIKNSCPNKYVYDISTEDGTFICGIGGVIAHNTDGFNFEIPPHIDTIKYFCKGTHRLTKKYANTELIGLDAVVAEFNEIYMIGRMGLDIDDICESTINFARKNYANKIIKTTKEGKTKTKIKLVGNSIKSDGLPGYIETFINNGIGYLLEGDGQSFINEYYKTVDDIYNYRIPVSQIASKAKVKISIDEYKKKMTKKNKAGSDNARQAHMELLIKEGITPKLGDVVYYVNTGTVKSHGDIKKTKNKLTKKIEIQFNCKRIPTDLVEEDPDFTTDDYNVPKYLDALNSRIKKLLVCFKPDVRDKILLKLTKDKKTKTYVLSERQYFTKEQCELCSGFPIDEKDQDDYYEDLMEMEDKEIRFWMRVDKVPNNMDETEWFEVRDKFIVRSEKEDEEGFENEIKFIDDVLLRLEIDDIEKIESSAEITLQILNILEVNEILDDEGELIDIEFTSKKYNKRIIGFNDLFKYKNVAEERAEYYETHEDLLENVDDKFKHWLENSGFSVDNEEMIEDEEMEDEWNF